MSKHNDILEKLDTLQKVALVSSALENETLEQAGLPPLGRVFLDDIAKKSGVAYGSAARAWDAGLVGKMTEELACEAGAEGARLAVTPDLKAAADPLGSGLSEDPFLCGALGTEIARAVHAAGMAAGLSRLSVCADDVSCLDRQADRGAIHDLFVKPFETVTGSVPCEAIFLTPNRAGSGYFYTNRALFSDVLNGRFGEDVFAVGEDTTPTSESLSLLRGKATLGGAKLPVERASRRYHQLTEYRKEGSVSDRDLEEAIRDGSALPEEKLDEVADEAIDFVLRVSSLIPSATAAGDEARRRVAEECIVLLRNEKILPFKEGTKLALVGETYRSLSPFSKRFEIVGRAKGYDRATDRSDELIPDAVRATDGADAVLVFLYPDRAGRALALPANRLALLDALKKTGKRIVALVCGDMPADMAFDAGLDASLLVPADGPYAAEALARVLSGEVCPSGRVARSLPDEADDYYRSFMANRDAGWMRVGGFAGYRRYDTAQENVRYPFGYGLSYTKFVYSRLTVERDEVSFTVQNTGTCAGSEVAQVYIGAPSVSRIMPRKQLKAFRKIFLQAGESKRITVPLPASAYETFDYSTLTENTEAGVYRIYVGASVRDIRLQGKRTLGGVKRAPSGETAADFFPNGDYKDVAEVRREDRLGSKKLNAPDKLVRLRKLAYFAMPAAAFLFFLLLTLLLFSYVLDYALFTALGTEIAETALFALAVCIIGVIPLLGAFNRKRLSYVRSAAIVVCPVLLFACVVLGYFVYAEQGGLPEQISFRVLAYFAAGVPVAAIVAAILERELIRGKGGSNRWEKYYRERERETNVTSETDFEEAFRAAEAARESAPVRLERETPPPPVPQFYDRFLTFSVLVRDCKQFAEERGILVEEATMRNWLAALMSTPLILVPRGDGAALCAVVAEYFGRKPYIDNAEQFARCEDLFSQWKQSEREYVRTGFSVAVAAAQQENVFLHTALIRHAEPTRLAQLLTPVADVIARRKTVIALPDGTEVFLPPNLRIVVEVERESIEHLPEAVAEVAAMLNPKCKEGEPVQKKTIVQSVGYERFAALRQTVRDEFPLGEGAWKNVDRLDARCLTAHIGNLLWLKMEMHASVVSACGGNEREALDGALAAELLPWLMETWKEEEYGAELLETLADIFGKNSVKLCREAIKARMGKESKR